MAGSAPFGGAARLRLLLDAARLIWGDGAAIQDNAAFATKSASSAAIAPIARPNAARYRQTRGGQASRSRGVRSHAEVIVGCGRRRGGHVLDRGGLRRTAQRASVRGRPGSAEAAAAAAEELPSGPDLVAARAQRQASAGGARREPEDRRQPARLRFHRLQFVVGDALSGQGPAPRRRPLRADQEAVP